MMLKRVFKLANYTIICLSAFLLTISIYGQDDAPVVTRSSNKILIGNDKFYVHVVKEKQTLYAICKAYNVSQEKLVKHNPVVSEGLKTGQVLKIPFKEAHYEVVQLDTTKYKYHIIKDDETLYSLSKEYEVPVDIITEHNPEVEYSNLQVNQVIKIPKQLKPKKDNQYIEHKVKRKETLYALSKKYNISIEKIIDVNKNIKEDGLQRDQIIKIPAYPDTADYPKGDDSIRIMPEQIHDSLYQQYYLSADCDTIQHDYTEDTIRVALLLPFMTERNKEYQKPDTIWINKNNNIFKLRKKENIYPVSSRFLEFYEGVLLALDSIKKTGVSVHLNTYDTKRDSATVVQILKEIKINRVDLMIGPAYSENLKIAAEFALEHEIPIVSPLSSKEEALEKNPYCFKINPSLDYELDHYMAYISTFHDNNIIMVYENHIADIDLVQLSREKLMKYFSYRNKIKDVVYKEIIYNDASDIDIEHALKADTCNYIIIPSQRESIVSSVIGKLNALKMQYDIKVFGMPVWPRFRHIDLENYYALNLVHYTPFYIDFEAEHIKDFIHRLRKRFYNDPYQITSSGYNYSMIGYDITMFFLTAIKTYGNHFRYCINDVNYKPLQTEFNFIQTQPNCGFENRNLIYMRYKKNLEIEMIEDTLSPSDIKSINDYINISRQKHEETLPKRERDTILNHTPWQPTGTN